MYFKHLAIAVLTTFSLTATQLHAQTLDEVLKQYYAANGAEAAAKLDAITMTGAINQAGLDIPFTMTIARPGKLRLEATFQGLTLIQTFNGTEGWSINPFGMSTEPEPVPADQIQDLKEQADIDGTLYNWAAKGYQVTLEGQEEVEGTNCYKIKVISPDSSETLHFLDADSYLTIKTSTKSKMMGIETVGETYMSNYFENGGVIYPGKIENRYNGMTGEVLTITGVIQNPTIDPAIFEKPVTK